MSEVVDERVVEMRFDNKDFESNVKTSMSTLEKLKQSLKLPGASKALEDVSKSAKKVDLSGLSSGVEEVNSKFSSLQVVGVTALATITNAAVNAGARIASALTIDPIISGFQEYETQIGAIQTILANTQSKGSTLEDVNNALDELNHYADKTIYNFTEMTKNIGTFTAAGVDLEKSVTAIKGIANLAAVSGSTSMQASTVMYQLSQALAAGRVSLMDWNSVVNGGMGGEVFQTALKRTAENMGTDVDALIEKYGSFRESLTQGGWLTAEVLTETLTQISGAYSKADLLAQGYTEDQAQAIVDLANTAVGAATEVKTFSALVDTTREALQSGWTQTWEIIFGDFEEAKSLFSGISETLSNAINESAEARNSLLQGWKDLGGRTALLDSFKNIFNGLLSVIEPIRDAFSEIFPPATAQQLYDITVAFRDFTSNLTLSDEAAANLKDTFKGVFTLIDLAIDAILNIGNVIFSVAGGFSGIANNMLEVTASIGNFISGIGNAASESQVFAKVADSVSMGLQGIFAGLSNIANIGFGVLSDIMANLGSILSSVGSVIGDALSTLWDSISQVLANSNLEDMLSIFNSGVMGAVGITIVNFLNSITDSIGDSTGTLMDAFQEFTGNISENVSGILDSVRGSLEVWQTSIKASILLNIAIAIGILAASLAVLSGIDKGALTNALGAITTMMIELVAALGILTKMTFGFELVTIPAMLIGIATSLLILSGALKSLSGLNIDQIQNGVIGIAGLTAALVLATKALTIGKSSVIKGALSMVIFASAIKLLASVCNDLADLDFDSMKKGLIGVSVLIAALSVFTKVGNFKTGIVSAAAGMLILSGSLKVFASAINDIGSMAIEKIQQGLISIAAILGEIVIFGRLMTGAGNIVNAAFAVALIGGALMILVPSLERLGNMSFESVGKSLIGMAGGLASVVMAIRLLPTTDMFALAALLPAMSSSLLVIAQAFERFNAVEFSSIAKGVIAFSTAMTVLVGAILLLTGVMKSKNIEADLWAISAVLPAMASSLLLIVEALERISALSWEDLAQGLIGFSAAIAILVKAVSSLKGFVGSTVALVILAGTMLILSAAISLLGKSGIIGTASALIALAGAFTIIGVAVKILSPLVPSIISLSGSITVLGLSLTVLGASIAVIGFGLLSFFTSFVAVIAVVSQLNMEDVGKGLLAIGGAFAVIGIAGNLLKPAIPSILSLAASIAALGLACLAVGAGVAVFVAALQVLSSMSETAVRNAIANIEIVIVGFIDLIPTLGSSLIEAITTILSSLISAIVELAPEIADGLLKVLVAVMGSLVEYTPQIVGYLFDFIIGIINGVAERMPELIQAIVNLVKSIFSGVIDALSGIDFNTILQGVTAIGLLSAMMLALSAVASLTGGAMVGVLGMGAVIAELSLVLAAIGALKQIPGLEWLVNEGGAFLQSIGTAIGQFVGGIVGGVAEGATASLPQIGTNLSQFMSNLQPFLDGASKITPETASAIESLASAILILTGSNLLDSITSFLTGGNDLGAFAEQIKPLGEAISSFASSTSGINAEQISVVATATKNLIEALSTIPNSGGFLDNIFGSGDIESFASGMKTMGDAIVSFYDATSGVNGESLTPVCEATKILIETLANVPNSGGFLDTVFGTPNFDNFSKGIESIGTAVSAFADSTSGIQDPARFSTIVTATKTLIEGLTQIPNSGGLLDSIFGGNKNFENFTSGMKQIGQGVSDFNSSTTGIEDAGRFSTVVTATKTLLEGLGNINPSGGLFEQLMSGTNFDNLSTSLGSFATAISSYAKNIGDTSFDNVESSVNAAGKIVDLIKKTDGITTEGVTAFKSAVEILGNVDISKIVDNFSGNVGDLASTGANIVKAIAEGITGNEGNLTGAGETVMSALLDTINGKQGDFNTAGSNLVSKLGEGIASSTAASDSVKTMMENAKSAADGYSDSFYDVGVNLVSGFASGIRDNIVTAANAAAAMASSASEAAKRNLDINSPSKVFRKIGSAVPEGFAQGITRYSSYVKTSVKTMSMDALDQTKSALSNLSDVINMDIDAEPTIRPVLDLSNVESGATAINRLFNQKALIGVTSDLGRISARMNARNQNGVNDDVVSELTKLRREIGDLNNTTYNVNGITYDDGTNVANAVKDLIRYSRVGRRE